MGRMGRRTRLTPELSAKIVQNVRFGVPLAVAAQGAGVPPPTFWEWMRRGEHGDQPHRPRTPLFAEFAEQVRLADAETHMLVMGRLVKNATSSTGNPWVALALINRKWAKEYADPVAESGISDVDAFLRAIGPRPAATEPPKEPQP